MPEDWSAEYGETVSAADVAILLGVALAVVIEALCIRMVGDLAESFGEERTTWQAWMLPLGVFGPMVAKILLDRRHGGGSGYA